MMQFLLIGFSFCGKASKLNFYQMVPFFQVWSIKANTGFIPVSLLMHIIESIGLIMQLLIVCVCWCGCQCGFVCVIKKIVCVCNI